MQKIDCIYIINLKKERSRLKQTLMLLADEEIHIPIKIFEATHWKSEFFEKIQKFQNSHYQYKINAESSRITKNWRYLPKDSIILTSCSGTT